MQNLPRKPAEGQQPQRIFPPAARPPQATQPDEWKHKGWRVMRVVHATQERIYVGARAFVVGDEMAGDVHITATALSALQRHAETHTEARRAGQPTVEFPNGLRRVA